jgi:hypothetical protein
MPTFKVNVYEESYYEFEMEAESEDEVRDKISKGEFPLDNGYVENREITELEQV